MRMPRGNVLVVTSRAEGGAIGVGLAVIKGTAEDQAKLPGGANVPCLGITAAATLNVDDPLPIVELGEVVAVADAAIAVNDLLMVNAATGKVAPIGAVAGTNYHVIGIAKTAAAAQNDEILMLVCPSRAQG